MKICKQQFLLATLLLLAVPALAAAPAPPDDISLRVVGGPYCEGDIGWVEVAWTPELFELTYNVYLDDGGFVQTVYNANSPELFQVPIPSDVTVTVDACNGDGCSGRTEIFWVKGDPNCSPF